VKVDSAPPLPTFINPFIIVAALLLVSVLFSLEYGQTSTS